MSKPTRRAGVRVAAGALAVCVILSVTGCFPSFGPAAKPHSAPSIRPTDGSTGAGTNVEGKDLASNAEVTAPAIPPGTEIATADLANRQGLKIAHLTVVTGEKLGMKIVVSDGVRVGIDHLELLRIPYDLVLGENCADAPIGQSIPDVDPAVPAEYSFGERSSSYTVDPTFIMSFALISPRQEWMPGECVNPIVAAGRITWMMPPMRPDIAAVDSGRAIGASGEAGLRDGVLSTYKVVGGDNLTQIAARFGLTKNELLFLNPRRTSSAGEYTAVLWETFNLENTPQGRSRFFPAELG